MKLWEGRFDEPAAKSLEQFNDSLPFDYRLWRADIIGSLAHAEMLGGCGIIAAGEAEKIKDGLESIYADIESGKLKIEGAEDIHSFVENQLVARIGDVGKKLHTARSRNDQVATDFRIYVSGAHAELQANLKRLISSLLEMAERGLKYIMPGYTHLRKAQPMCAGHFFNAYSEMFLRDLERSAQSAERCAVLPLGSGALAGTSYPIDRRVTAERLGFKAPCENSLDGVSDRDFVAEYLFDCSLAMAHLSRLCEDIILYTTEEFGFFEISDRYSTGSSIMPQKKNPDIPELIRGKTGRVYGHLVAILTTIKALPLAYNKDLQEDKEGLFDAQLQVNSCLSIMAEMLPEISFRGAKMKKAAEGEFCCATDVADYLAKKGMPFRDAHSTTGKIVRYCIAEGKTLQSMTAEDYKKFSPLFDYDITEAVKGKACADARTSYGGAAASCVKANIRSLKKRLKKY